MYKTIYNQGQTTLDRLYLQLVSIKTLQSLHAKFRIINESFETSLDCTIILNGKMCVFCEFTTDIEKRDFSRFRHCRELKLKKDA